MRSTSTGSNERNCSMLSCKERSHACSTARSVMAGALALTTAPSRTPAAMGPTPASIAACSATRHANHAASVSTAPAQRRACSARLRARSPLPAAASDSSASAPAAIAVAMSFSLPPAAPGFPESAACSTAVDDALTAASASSVAIAPTEAVLPVPSASISAGTSG